MKRIELNREGYYDRWNPDHLNELHSLNQLVEGQDCILHEDSHMRLKVFGMEPYERIPFRVLQHKFTLVCLTGGTAITRSCKGAIDLLIFERGETVTRSIESAAMVNDLQNIGEDQMIVALIEYLRPVTYGEWVDGALISTPSTPAK